jgi:hypothetical protein
MALSIMILLQSSIVVISDKHSMAAVLKEG